MSVSVTLKSPLGNYPQRQVVGLDKTYQTNTRNCYFYSVVLRNFKQFCTSNLYIHTSVLRHLFLNQNMFYAFSFTFFITFLRPKYSNKSLHSSNRPKFHEIIETCCSQNIIKKGKWHNEAIHMVKCNKYKIILFLKC